MHGIAPETVKCPAIDGILELEEGDEIAGEVADKNVLDVHSLLRGKPSSITKCLVTEPLLLGQSNWVAIIVQACLRKTSEGEGGR